MTPQTERSAATSGMPLAVVWRRIAELQSDPEDPRSQSPKQIRRLARSVAAFGFNVPILIDRGLLIVAGQGRLLAARELGWSEVPTILLDHLSPAQARAFMIADNRLAETASWDDLLLAMQLKELSPGDAGPILKTACKQLITSAKAGAHSGNRSRPPPARQKGRCRG